MLIMRDMTEEEYDALDERLTKTVPKLGHTGKGFFTRVSSPVIFLKNETADLLESKAAASNQTPSDYIDYILRKEVTVNENMNNSQKEEVRVSETT